MKRYAPLLDDAVPLVNAERGFVVLYDATTDTFTYVATHNFVPANNGYSDKMFADLMAAGEAVVTNNLMIQKYLPQGIISTLSLRTILIVPLRYEDQIIGLLWCDRNLQEGPFNGDNLARLVDLVEDYAL